MDPITIQSTPGTFVDAAWPAGVSKATTAASFILTSACCVTLAKLLAASEEHQDRAMAVWTGAVPASESFGTDQRGEIYGVTLLDDMGGGAGARATKDGIDTGGLIRTISCSLANVETYEFRYPLLYLYRRQQCDTGGAGKFRGGVAISKAFTPHDVAQIPGHVSHTTGCEEPESVGIGGGYPASTNQFVLLRDSNVAAQFAQGHVPSELDELEGRLEIAPALVSTHLNAGDVFRTVVSGGGGYGDPLERDPRLVLHDVLHGLVSAESATAQYGVVLAPDGQAVDAAATESRRDALRAARRP
jgi:N-methylhydantoinase B